MVCPGWLRSGSPWDTGHYDLYLFVIHIVDTEHPYEDTLCKLAHTLIAHTALSDAVPIFYRCCKITIRQTIGRKGSLFNIFITSIKTAPLYIMCYNFHQKEVTMKTKYQEDGLAYQNHYRNNVFGNFHGTLDAATVLQTGDINFHWNVPAFAGSTTPLEIIFAPSKKKVSSMCLVQMTKAFVINEIPFGNYFLGTILHG